MPLALMAPMGYDVGVLGVCACIIVCVRVCVQACVCVRVWRNVAPLKKRENEREKANEGCTHLQI